jgi:hypothetical protein
VPVGSRPAPVPHGPHRRRGQVDQRHRSAGAQFTSNAVFYGGVYDPLGCGIDDYFYSRLAAGNMRYLNGTLAAMDEISAYNNRIRLICV